MSWSRLRGPAGLLAGAGLGWLANRWVACHGGG